METQVLLTNAFVSNPEQAQKYVSIIASVNRVDPDQAKGIYLAEVDFFMKAMESDNKLMQTTYESKLGVFVDVITNSLSFSPHLRHVYIESRSVKIKSNPDVWESRLTFKTSPQGKIFLCQQAGSVDHVTPPEMVYNGDLYEVVTINGVKNIKHQRAGKSPTIVAGFCYVALPNGTMEGHELTIAEDIERLKGYSNRQNKGKGANLLYTSDNGQIDKGFFGAKLISHSLKWYRSKRIVSSYLEENSADEEMGTDYGMTFPAHEGNMAVVNDPLGPEYQSTVQFAPSYPPLPVPVPPLPASNSNGPRYPEFAPPGAQYVDFQHQQVLTHAEPSAPPAPPQYTPAPPPVSDLF